MPEVPENLDKQRLEKVRGLAVKAAGRWLEMNNAADNRDPDGCRRLYRQIREVTVEVSDLLKALGTEKANG